MSGKIEKLLTVAELAKELDVTPDTIYRWAESGDLPVLRLGRILRFRRDDLEAWLRLRSSSPNRTLAERPNS